MKKRNLFFFVLLLFFVTVFSANILASDTTAAPSDAQPETLAPTPAEEPVPALPSIADDLEQETEFSYGTVKNVGLGELIVSEYDYESNADLEVAYKVPSDVEFENVTSLSEIAIGDAVDIDYILQGSQKTTVAIAVEKPISEDEEAALIPADEEPKE